MNPSYKETLNLPQTPFPMKASLATRELEQIELWKKQDIYHQIQEKNKHNPPFILHDGPPYANGHLHVGHALNKILKDIIVKYKSKSGFSSPYIPGWDCHGLPIEIQAQKKLKVPYSKNELRDTCKNHAQEFIDIQKQELERLMVFGDYTHRYATMDYTYESEILGVLKTAVSKDLVYRGNRPVHWCIHCATALADAEIEYATHESPSLYVSFSITNQPHLDFLVWTTTPWTLVANVGLAINQNIAYAIYTHSGREYIIAKELVQSVEEKTGHNLVFKQDISVQELLTLEAQHPFLNRSSRVILGDHVTLDAGTGIVHTAPSHGEEDFIVGYVQNKLPIIMAVNNYGKFTQNPLAEGIDFILGDNIWIANPKIIQKLEQTNHLFFSTAFKHSYPHCWRCKNPIIVRTTHQWFINMSSLIPVMQSQIEDNVNFIPADRKQRILSIIDGRPDWCISRQRAWGVPIPSIQCACGEETLDVELMNIVQAKIAQQGANFWFDETITLAEIFSKILQKECLVCGQIGHYTKGQDILDVWFDSAVSWKDLLQDKLHLPLETDVQLYLEGNDQFRSWYQVSLITGLIEKNKAPYQSILTHGMVLDEKGKAMSKSLGNVISPLDIAKNYGADILRLWVVSQTYTEDIRIGKSILDQISDSYRKIRNTFRFLLSNLYDYTQKDFESFNKEERTQLDKWVLYKLNLLQHKVKEAYDSYKFDTVLKDIFTFMNEDLSSFYLDVLKDPLYTLAPNSVIRRSAQYSMLIISQVLSDLLCPILSFTAEEVYEYLPFTSHNKSASIFLSDSLNLDEFNTYQKDYEHIEDVLSLRLKVLKELESLRQEKVIGSNLEAKVIIQTSQNNIMHFKDLDFYFIVSECEIQKVDHTDLNILVSKVDKYKCPRCYRYVSLQPDSLCGRCEDVLQ